MVEPALILAAARAFVPFLGKLIGKGKRNEVGVFVLKAADVYDRIERMGGTGESKKAAWLAEVTKLLPMVTDGKVKAGELDALLSIIWAAKNGAEGVVIEDYVPPTDLVLLAGSIAAGALAAHETPDWSRIARNARALHRELVAREGQGD